MRVDTRKLRDIQRKVAKEASAKDEIELDKVKTIAGFDLAFVDDKIYCAAVVLDANTLEILEVKHSVSRAPMHYIPGYLAFREGPAIMQTYYDLEHEPDVLFIDGHGMAHPLKCGLATYVGVELAKPTIGVAKKILMGEVQNEKLTVNGETRGMAVKSKEHAKPIYVSVGHNISLKNAVELVRKTLVHPHKLPEPLHHAHRLAKKTADTKRDLNGKKIEAKEPKEAAQEIEAEICGE